MRKHGLVILTVFALMLTGMWAAAQEKASIWGDPIQKQMFDKEPLREIKIPAWLEDVPYNTYCISQFNLYERAAQAGAKRSPFGMRSCLILTASGRGTR